MSTPELPPPPDPERLPLRAPGRRFRPSTPADAAGIAALLDEAGLHPDTRPEVVHWKYWQTECGWSGARSFVLTEGAAIIAHSAIVPGVLAFGPQRLPIIQAVDWAARAQATGAGVALLKRLAKSADAMLAIGGTARTRQILPHLGFKPAGESTSYVRTLRPWRMLGARSTPWRLLPRLARSVAWTLRAPARGRDDFTVRRLSPGTVAQLRPALPAPSGDLAVLERSEAGLRHALSCPLVPMELYAVERSGRVQGYFLLAIAGRQARLADCWMAAPEPAAWRSLVQCAVQQARRHTRTAEIVASASDPLLSRSLLDCGFHARGTHPVLLMMQPGRDAPAATLRVQMLDADAAYLEPSGQNLLA